MKCDTKTCINKYLLRQLLSTNNNYSKPINFLIPVSHRNYYIKPNLIYADLELLSPSFKKYSDLQIVAKFWSSGHLAPFADLPNKFGDFLSL